MGPITGRPRDSGLAILGLVAACACASKPAAPAPAQLPVLDAGDAQLAFDADGGTLSLRRGGNDLLTFGADAFQLGLVDAPLDLRNSSYDPYWLEPAHGQAVVPPSLVWQPATAVSLATQTADSLILSLTFASGTAQLTLHNDEAGSFSAKWVPAISDSKKAIAWMRLRARVNATEEFYGLGEWGDQVTHRGTQRPMQIEPDALESGYNEAHAPVPLLIGTRGWGLFVASRRAGLFDVARKDPAIVEVTFGTADDSANGLALHLFAADPIDVTKLYDDVAGAPKLPAPWALGPVMWRNETTDQAQFLDDAAQLRARHLPASAIWLDRPYASGVNTFDFDPSKFTDAPAAIQQLQAAGLRVAVWHTPYLAPAGNTEASAALNDQATADGYFPPEAGLVLLNSWSAPIDFTNPVAATWWQSLLHRYTDVGIEGFKLDFGEDVQIGLWGVRDPWRFSDGSDERTMQSNYPILYHQTYAQLLPVGGGFLLCRTGRWGDQVNGCIIWPGDLESDFSRERDALPGGKRSAGGLPAAMFKGLGLGVSGFPFYASDTGGFRDGPPSQELLLRWTEMSAVGSAMEVGNGSSTMPWEQLDATGLATYQRYAKLAMQLFPYKWTLAQKLAVDGRALQRPVGLAFPAVSRHPSDELLLGDSLFAAPVLEAAQTTRHLLLPPGDWYGWWDGAKHSAGAQGAELDVPAPLDTLPLFLRAGALVPMLRPEIETLAPATNPGVESFPNDAGILFVRAAPGPDATFTVYDGCVLTQRAANDGRHLGFTAGSVFRSGVIFELIATPQPSQVAIGGAPLPQLSSADALRTGGGWFWEAATGGTLWIRSSSGGDAVVTP